MKFFLQRKLDASRLCFRNFPGGPLVKSLPSNAGDTGSIPGWGMKITQTEGLLRLCAITKRSPHNTTKILHAATDPRQQ